MGEVFARASKLDRFVANKILQETVARDADRLARLDREAGVLTAVVELTVVAAEDLTVGSAR